MTPFCDPVAAERNINIIPEPGGQGNMPAAPEFLDGKGKIGAFEIRHQTNPEHPGAADGNVGVTRKITVDFDCEHQGSDDKSESHITVHIVEKLVHGDCECIGDNELFEISPGHELQPVSHMIVGKRMLLFILREQRIRPSDRSGKKLREEGNKQRIIAEMPFRRYFTVIYIYQISHRLEKVERDTCREKNRHRERLHRQPARVNHLIQPLYDGIGRLEENENQDERQDAKKKPSPFLSVRVRFFKGKREHIGQ